MKIRATDGIEVVLEGLAVGPGIALGVAHVHESGALTTPEYTIADHRLEAERNRFIRATTAAQRHIKSLRDKAAMLPREAADELGLLLDAYGAMLKDSRLVRGVLARITRERLNAEAAVRRETVVLCEAFTAMDDAYLAARAADVREVGARLIGHLTGATHGGNPLESLPRNAIVVARELTPADTALLDPERVAGFATAAGGADSHTAIMARSLGLPAVLAVAALLNTTQSGDVIIIDGHNGRVIVRPSEATLADYRRRRADSLRQRRALARLRDVPAETLDGVRIELCANIERPGEVASALAAGAEGIGLFRSEFMFMNRATLPSEDEQYAVLHSVVSGMGGRAVTIRVLDSGGEKLLQTTTSTPAVVEANPALGLRGVRFLLAHPTVLETQLAAILRAAQQGPVRILLPMISTVDEVVAVRACLRRVQSRLYGDAPHAALPPLGVMIEVPGAALAADALATVSDFFAIGTNDLTQYTLAIDRSDKAVAHLYNPVHASVLRLILFTVGAAQRAGIPVSLCGEMAGDPRLARLLVGLGIRALSMAAGSLPKVKHSLRRVALVDVQTRATQLMLESNPRVIDTLLSEFS